MEKLGKVITLLFGHCSICNRKKPNNVVLAQFLAERLGDFFKHLGKKGTKFPRRWLKMPQKIQEELWGLHKTLVVYWHLEIRKQLCQSYLM